MCPHTTMCVSSYYYMCVLILCVSSYYYICVLILLYVSAYYYTCGLILLHVSSYSVCVREDLFQEGCERELQAVDATAYPASAYSKQ